MTIQSNNGDIEIKSKNAIFSCNKKAVNSITIAGPGEYEVADMAITAYDHHILQITAEGISVAYFERTFSQAEKTMLDELAESNIALLKLSNTGLTVDQAQKLIQTVEPKIIIPVDHDLRQSFCTMIGECPEPVKIFKITKINFTSDENQRIVLMS